MATNKTEHDHNDVDRKLRDDSSSVRDEGIDSSEQLKDSRKKYRIFGRYMELADIIKFSGFLVFIIAMIAIFIFIWPYISELFEPGGYQRVIDQVRNAGFAGMGILLVIQFLQIVVAFIPGEVVQIAAGMVYGPWIGALIIWVGCILSSAFIFVLVHKLGAPFVQSMVPEKYMDKLTSFEKSGRLNIVIFILFLIPGLPKDIFTYIAPLTHLRMPTFLILTNVARIPGIILSTFAAAGLVNGNIALSIILFVIVAAIAIVALFTYERIMRYFEKRFHREGLDMNSIDESNSHNESGENSQVKVPETET